MAWSPDGKQILVLIRRGDRTNQIALIAAEGGTPRILKSLDWRSPIGMAFSSDSKYIAYDFSEKPESEDRDIFVLAADGTRETRVAAGPGDDVLLGWEATGDRIVFRSDRAGAIGLWCVEMSGGNARGAAQLIKADIGNVTPVGFTKRGAYYYTLQTSLSDVYTAPLKAGSSDFASEPLSIQAHMQRANSTPDLSSDGKYLAYSSRRIGTALRLDSASVVIRAMDTGQERELKPKLQSFHHMRLSPDGRSILFVGYDLKGRYGAFIVDTQTGDVGASVLNCYAGEWLRDGKTIIVCEKWLSRRRPIPRAGRSPDWNGN